MQVADQTASKLTAVDVMTQAPRTRSLFSSVLEAVLVFHDADFGAMAPCPRSSPGSRSGS